MKKLFLTFGFSLVFVQSAFAATIVSDYASKLHRNETKDIAPVILTSTADNDITAEHGIRVLLDQSQDVQILFDDRALSFIGNAIDKGKISLNVQPSYSADRKSLFIPVLEDFEGGEWLSIQGLALRAYDEDFGPRRLGLDLDGDLSPDVEDINTYKVEADADNDTTPPFPVSNATHVINSDGSVTLTWDVPPDFDYDASIINRTRIKNGQPAESSVYNGYIGSFTDSNLKDVTSASYSIVAVDADGNWSPAVVVEVDLTVPEEEPEPTEEEEPVQEPESPAEVGETEVEELGRLMNYYNVRYSIKCKPSGVPVPENNSACLWARIDLIYAQEVTGDSLVADLSLSQRDLELMATRRRWPEMRYEDNCVLAQEPASYCSALGKALDRISYFLD